MNKEHIERFITLTSLEMPELILPSGFQGAEIYEDSALLTFSLPMSYPMEDLLDEIENQTELVLLYHHIPTTDTTFGQRCCAYSNPHFGKMYKMNAIADGDIKCDTLDVTLYDSLEIMVTELRSELAKLGRYGVFAYSRSEEELLRNFF